jgi:allophanate hydrolase
MVYKMKTVSLPKTFSIEWLRNMYIREEITPEYVICQILARVEADEEMNIWITPPTIRDLQPYLDRLSTTSPAELPLWGIPFAIKDNIDVKDIPTTAGCEEYTYTPSKHATVVQRLVDAGAIPLGKTNLDQFATGLVGTRSPYGETHNALKPELISGGSSSGSAVSVARGHAAFSLGTDTAGSGRVPAGLNRLIGYKPSLGAWPSTGVVPACKSLDCVTAFTHEWDDVLLIDSVIRGIDKSDPWSRRIVRTSSALPEKIYLVKDIISFYGPFAKEYEEAWKQTVKKIESLSIPIEYIDGSYLSEAASLLYDGPYVAERWSDLGEFVTSHRGKVFPVTEQVLRSGSKSEYDASALFQALHRIQSFKHQAHQQFKNSVLVMPTAGGTWTREQVRENPIETNSCMGHFTNHCNLLDLCAVSLPSNDASTNLPFGVSFFSTFDGEKFISGLSELFLHGELIEKTPKDKVLLAVCGLHMRGLPLESQMIDHGASFIRKDQTAPHYQFFKLPFSPTKPGLLRTTEQGERIEVEIWEMPLASLGSFAASIPSPLGIGKITLQDGNEVIGFLCEAYATENAENITSYRSWRAITD